MKRSIIFISLFLAGILLSLQGSNLYQITEDGSIAISYDYGRTWTWNDGILQVGIVGIVPGDTTELYAVDNNGNVYYSSDEGNNWTIRGSIDQTGISGIEYDALRDDLYVVTNAGKVFVSNGEVQPFTLYGEANQVGIVDIGMDRRGYLYLLTASGEVFKFDGGNFLLYGNMDASNLVALVVKDTTVYGLSDEGYVYEYSTSKGSIILGSVSQIGSRDMMVDNDTIFYVVTDKGELFKSGDAISWTEAGSSSQNGVKRIASSVNVTLSIEGVFLAGVFNENRVELRWYDREKDNGVFYRLYRSLDNEHYEKIFEGTSSNYDDYGIKENRDYFYRVEAIGKKKTESNVVKVKTGNIVLKRLRVERTPFVGTVKVYSNDNPVYVYDLNGRLKEISTNGIIGKNLGSGVFILKSPGYKSVIVEKIY